MSKKKYLSVILIISLISISYFSIITPGTQINVDEQKNINNTDVSNLRSSAVTVTSLKNYSSNRPISNLAISADGNYIILSSDYNLVLFNKSSSKPMWNVSIANNIAIMDIAISANGTYITAGTEAGVLLFNNTYSTTKTPMWNCTLGEYGRSVAISADGTYIAVGSWNYNVYLFNNTYSTSKTHMWSFTTQNYVDSVAISDDGTYIAAGGWDDCIYFLNNTYSTSKTAMWSYNNTNDVKEVDISVDGRYIVAAHSNSNGGNISYFDTMQKTRLWKYDHHPNYDVHSVDMSSDGKYLVARGDIGFKAFTQSSGFFDNSIQTPKSKLWDYSCNNNNNPKISADGYYAVVGDDHNVSLLDKSSSVSKEYIWDYEMDLPARNVAISANSSYIAASIDHKVYLLYWDVPEHIYSYPASSSSGDDDDDDEAPGIPFGNYYLLFAAIAVISLIMIMKRNIIFNKK